VYIKILKDAGLEPLGLWSVMTDKSIIEIEKCVVAAWCGGTHTCNGTSNCPLKTIFWDLKIKIDGLATGTRGVCLDCIKAEREVIGLNMPQTDNPGCRVDHDKSTTNV
jgi:hypothetical protein